jgi:hypothetical protein
MSAATRFSEMGTKTSFVRPIYLINISARLR